MEDFHQLVQLCQEKTVYIQTHNVPDADAIASAFGLQRLLQCFQIESTICYAGRIDTLSATKMLETFGIEMVSYDELCHRMSPDDVVICVDSQKNGGNLTDVVGNNLACIDHHPTFVPAEYQFAEIGITGACASLIARYYQAMNVRPDVDTATALMYGLRMDTLQLSRGVTQLDIEMLAFLFPLCDEEVLSSLERNNMELYHLRAYVAALDSVTLYGRVAFAKIPFTCPDGLVASLSDFILSLEEVLVAVVLCFREDEIKISVRSEMKGIHAGELVRRAITGLGDGGGHSQMAGGIVRRDRMREAGVDGERILCQRVLPLLEEILPSGTVSDDDRKRARIELTNIFE